MKNFLEKYWLAILIMSVPLMFAGWFIFSIYDVGFNGNVNYDEHPSIEDVDWQKDMYGGTGVGGW